MTTEKAYCTGVKRLNNSNNGNPKYKFYFKGGGVCTTQPNAGWVYGLITSPDWAYRGKWVNIDYHFTKGGQSILDGISLNK
tara:strand:- start:521 stop:763 length:243 start_codon:yes stop_codon:yes gene_type:complete